MTLQKTKRIEVLPSLKAVAAEMQLLMESDSAWEDIPLRQVKLIRGLLANIELAARHQRTMRLGDTSPVD